MVFFYLVSGIECYLETLLAIGSNEAIESNK